jgi:hypothetical protein
LLRLITKRIFDQFPEPEAGRRAPGRGAAVQQFYQTNAGEPAADPHLHLHLHRER